MTATSPTVTVRRARRRFEAGMIVLARSPTSPSVIVWTVARVTVRGTTLLADYGAEQAEAQLTGPDSAFVPDGWRVIDHDAIARVFSGTGQAADLDDAADPLPVASHATIAVTPEEDAAFAEHANAERVQPPPWRPAGPANPDAPVRA